MSASSEAAAVLVDQLEGWRRDRPEAYALAALCAYMSGRPIPKSVFVAISMDVEPRNELWTISLHDLQAERLLSPSGLTEAIRACVGANLMTASTVAMSMHPSIQTAIRAHLFEDERHIVRLALRIIEAGFPSNVRDTGLWPAAAQLRAHAEAVLDHAVNADLEDPSGGRLARSVSSYTFLAGDPNRAVRTVETGLKLSPQDDESVGELLDALGAFNREIGDLEAAARAYGSLLEWSEARGTLLATAWIINVAMWFYSGRDLDTAEELLRRAIAEAEDLLNEADALGNLGVVLRDRGRRDEAEEVIRRSLSIREYLVSTGELPSEHYSIADDHANLGTVLHDRGRFEDALAEHRIALRMHIRQLGNIHQSVAGDYGNIGNVMLAMDLRSDAINAFERAVEVFRELYGEGSPQTQGAAQRVRALRNLGD